MLTVRAGWDAGKILGADKSSVFFRTCLFFLLLAASVCSEMRISKDVLSQKPGSDQKLLDFFSRNTSKTRGKILISDWYQNDIFYAEVVCGLDVVAFHDFEPRRLRVGDYLMTPTEMEDLKILSDNNL